jgi:threonine dehydrogenase-like Zn-dependent dehydrogenase
VAIEAAGAPQALLQTIQVTRPRGSVVFGGNQPLDQSLPMAFIEDVMRKELRLNGCFMSYSAPFPVMNGQTLCRRFGMVEWTSRP